jgi:hypothetical protein
MKVQQPITNQTIFFVKELHEELDIPIYVAFDDADTAKSYINRFKTLGDTEILECRLNPGFYTDITKDCYFIQINLHTDQVITYLVTDLYRSDLAKNGYYCFDGEDFLIYLMASSENEAIKAARKIRDSAGNRLLN